MLTGRILRVVTGIRVRMSLGFFRFDRFRWVGISVLSKDAASSWNSRGGIVSVFRVDEKRDRFSDESFLASEVDKKFGLLKL